MTGDKGAWGGDGAREYWRAALRGCQQSLQAQWPPVLLMMSLKARKPFIQGANLPPGRPEDNSESLVPLGL